MRKICLLDVNWEFGDGTTGTGLDPMHAYSSPGIYTIMLTVIDGRDSDSVSTTATVQ